jgi:mannosylglucosylglycerate synthase
VNVALIHYAVPPVVGGVESVVAHQARLLSSAGHSVRLLAGRGETMLAHIPVYQLPLADSQHPRVLAVKLELDDGRIPPDFEALKNDIANELRAALQGVDVLLAHNVASLAKNLALTAALHDLNGQPDFPRTVLWHHDLAWTTPRYAAELHAGYPWDLLRNDWPNVTHVVVSRSRQSELADLLSKPAAHIRVVPNGVDDATLFKLEPQTISLVRAMNLRGARPLLLLPVRLTPRKNIELALRALSALRAIRLPAVFDQPDGATFEHAALVVTGPEGPHNARNAAYRDSLLALRASLGLDGAAHFAVEHSDRFLPDAVVADFYRLADALILPSREEGFGIPIIEAATARLPVFCTDIAPLRELGGQDVDYFAPDDDPAAIARLIAERLSSLRQYRLAARAKSDYTWDAIYWQHIAPLLAEHATGF